MLLGYHRLLWRNVYWEALLGERLNDTLVASVDSYSLITWTDFNTGSGLSRSCQCAPSRVPTQCLTKHCSSSFCSVALGCDMSAAWSPSPFVRECWTPVWGAPPGRWKPQLQSLIPPTRVLLWSAEPDTIVTTEAPRFHFKVLKKCWLLFDPESWALRGW